MYTSPDEILKWNAASDDWHTTRASVDLRMGGTFSCRMEAKDSSFGFDFSGIYTNILANRLLEYSFGDRTAKVNFTPSENGVNVKVVFDAEATHPIEQQQSGWQAILNNLKCYIEHHK